MMMMSERDKESVGGPLSAGPELVLDAFIRDDITTENRLLFFHHATFVSGGVAYCIHDDIVECM